VLAHPECIDRRREERKQKLALKGMSVESKPLRDGGRIGLRTHPIHWSGFVLSGDWWRGTGRL